MNKDKVQKAVDILKQMKGVKQVSGDIPQEIKREIEAKESENNIGVKECVSKRTHCICLTHNSEFRDAMSPIVIHNKNTGKYYFPPIIFPEISENNTVSSSPSETVHKYLIEILFDHTTHDINYDATILVAFD